MGVSNFEPMRVIVRRVKSTSFALAGASLAACVLVGCSAGAVQRNAVCDRGTALELAVSRTSELGDEALSLNADVLRNQVEEDISTFLVSSDVAPDSLSGDLSTMTTRLQVLTLAYAAVNWDQAEAAVDNDVREALDDLAGANSRRLLVRITDFLLKECETEAISDSPPPDSAVVTIAPSTSIAPALPDRETPDPPISSAHIALGKVVAESRGIPIDDAKAECLGREIEAVTGAEAATTAEEFERAYDQAFVACGVG
jgi:hypothetical protein